MNTTTIEKAKAAGYRPLTTGYILPSEQWMLDNVLADMSRAGADIVLVQIRKETEVWRKIANQK